MLKKLFVLFAIISFFSLSKKSIAENFIPKKSWDVSYKGKEDGDANYRVTHAAKELCEYINKVTGKRTSPVSWEKANAKIIFLITEAKYVPEEISKTLIGKNQDAFLIKYPYIIDGKKVCLLVSRDNRAYDFPVYYFLRKYMGVDWVGPGELGKVIPKNSNWKMPEQINILENPDFAMRLWYDGKFLTSLPNFAMARPLLVGNQRMGFHHAFGNIFNPKKYAKSDPDIYPLINGKRFTPTKGDGLESTTSGWQPCLGNPKTQDIAVKWVLDQYKKNQGLMSISLSVNDGDSNHCTCSLCQAMDIKDAFKDPLNPRLSDRYFRFYNKVIERVLKVKPDAYIAVLGYGPCGIPPLKTKINNHIIVFITTGANPLQFAKAGGASSLYQYHLDNAYPTIRHYPHMLATFLKKSHQAGAIGYYAQIEHNWAAGGPKTYVLARLLWDVNTNVDKTLAHYFLLALGKNAGGYVRKYFEQWEKIWEREAKNLKNPYNTIYEWESNHIKKFRYITWADIEIMDKLMAKAENAKKNKMQQKRFAMFNTYYRWIRNSLVQYLLVSDINNPKWLLKKSKNKIFVTIERSLALTTVFDKTWDKVISKDRTGWLLNQSYQLIKAVEKGNRFYDSLLVEPIRSAIEDFQAGGIAKAFRTLSTNIEKTKNKNKTKEFWQKTIKTYPQLRSYIQPEINRLQGIIRQNLLTNGGFEKGKSVGKTGEPPYLKGWWFYDRVGMVRGSKGLYKWDKSGRDASMAIGMGHSKYPGMRSVVKLNPGRYKFSIWMKTVNRKLTIDISAYLLAKDVSNKQLLTAKGIRSIKNNQYIKFLRRTWPPTNSKWKKVTQRFELKEKQKLMITLEPFYMGKGEWCWFDNAEIVKLD